MQSKPKPPASRQSRKTKDPWPTAGKASSEYVSVMFVDVRNSSHAAARPDSSPDLNAQSLAKMYSKVKEIWHRVAPAELEPTSVQLRGDGMMIVWSQLGRDRRKHIVQFALALHNNLKEELDAAEAWISGWGGLGIGIASGPASAVKYGHQREFFGHTLNLAHKLQSHARPYGVVAPASFLHSLDEWKEFQGSFVTRSILEPLLGRDQATSFYTTKHVLESQPWKCIAFPGYASSITDPEKHVPLHMNGVSVLSHEGISGRIRSLSLWTKNELLSEESTRFEIFIDDLDVLEEWRAEGVAALLPLTPNQGRLTNELKAVSRDLRNRVLRGKIVAIPTRCGLNAAAINWSRCLSQKQNVNSYLDLLNICNGSRAIGFWDNALSSLPPLLLSFKELGLTPGNIHKVGRDKLKLFRELLEGWKGDAQLDRPFRVYGQIFQMANALQDGKEIFAVLGGGAWMFDPKDENVLSEIEVVIPPNDGALVWVEAAGFNGEGKAASEWTSIANWIRRVLHSEEAQQQLQRTYPYPACPVVKQSIGQILESGTEVSAIERETKQIFSTLDSINENLCVRALPEERLAWRETWEFVKRSFATYND